MKKVIGIDYGKVRIGLATSDEKKQIAFPLKCLKGFSNLQKNAQEVFRFLSTLVFSEIVIGLPLLMNGQDSDLTREVRAFAALLQQELEKQGLSQKIILWDERLSSKQAEKLLIESGVKRKNRTDITDSMAATLILQSYLDAHSSL